MARRNVRYAGFWVRLVAAVLDFIIIGIPGMLIVAIYFGLGLLYDENVSLWSFLWALFKADLLYYLILLVVTVYLWVNWDGRTPGKKLMGIRVVTFPGYGRLAYRDALIRYVLGYPLSALVLWLGFVLIAVREDKRGLHDLIAGTCVVYE